MTEPMFSAQTMEAARRMSRSVLRRRPATTLESDDLTQDTLLRHFERSGSWELLPSETPAVFWPHAVTAWNRYRRRNRIEEHQVALSEITPPAAAGPAPAVEAHQGPSFHALRRRSDPLAVLDAGFDEVTEAVARRQVEEILSAGIRSLPPRQRQAVLDRLAGRGVGDGAERVAYSTAVASLRRHFEQTIGDTAGVGVSDSTSW